MVRACSIFFFEGHVGVSPTVLNISRLLDRHSYVVTIFATRNPYPAPLSIGNTARAVYLRRLPGRRWALAALRRLRLGSAAPGIDLVLYIIQCLVRVLVTMRGRVTSRGPSIGIDTNGAIVAFLRRWLTGGRYIYLSLELRDPRLARGVSAFINPLERAAYRKADAVVIQDDDRLRTLNEYLRFNHPNVIFLPNSPSGSDVAGSAGPDENFFRRRLAISETTFPVIVLQAGMIDPAVFSEELASTFVSVDRGCALVFHERLRRTESDPYIQRVRNANRENLFLSLEPVPIEELDRVFESATIGLAFYRESDANFSQISMASGKIGYYLKHGKPLLVSGTPSLARFIERTGAGLVVSDPTNPIEVEMAIDELLQGYAQFSANARACFEQELDFDHSARQLQTVLDNL